MTQIRTGLSEREWEDLWARIVSAAKYKFHTEVLAIGFEEWRNMVVAEGENRRFISYATTGKRIGLRKGIAQVVSEIRNDLAEEMIQK